MLDKKINQVYNRGIETKGARPRKEVFTMTNLTILQTMTARYEALAFTHNYIFGFIDRGIVYAVVTDSSVLPYALTLDRASSKNGGGYSVRFSPNKAQKEMLKTAGKLIAVCSEDQFNEMVKTSKYNKGEIFEMLMTEYFGQTWTKDNVPFTEAGDIEAEGIAYQVKFQKATFCTESSLRNLSK